VAFLPSAWQLPHNHIVRTVDLNAAATHVLSGGHEKRLRIWDLSKVDADGKGNDWDALEFKLPDGAPRAHDGTIKSAVWDEKRNAVVSMGEDRVIRCVRCRRCAMSGRVEVRC
jgi:serine-threonine kinase receptor-associated protein